MSASVEARLLRAAFAAGTGKILWDVFSRSLSFVLSILVARKLGAEGFGSFAVYWYSALILSQLTDLGLHLVSLRSLARAFEPRVLWSAAAAKGALTVVVLLGSLVGALAGALPADGTFALFLFTLLTGTWVDLAGIVLRSRGLLAREGLLLAALRLAWLAAAAAALSRSGELAVLAAALALASLPALGVVALFLSRIRIPPEGGPLRGEASSLLRQTLPLALTGAITLVYLRADLLIVAALRDAAEAGLFQSAFRLFEASFVFSGAVVAGTFPLLVSRRGRREFAPLARFVLALLLLLGATLAFLFGFFGEELILLLYGEGFLEAARPLTFLGIALVAVFANALTTHLLVISGRSLRLIGSMLVRLVVGLALDLLLVPSWGATGAALAVAAAEWSLTLVSLAWVLDLLQIPAVAKRTLPREEVSPCS